MNDFEPCGTFRDLTRPELDELIHRAEHAETKAQIALRVAPLRPEALADAAGVAQDCMGLYVSLLHESIWRLWHGEPANV